MEISPQLMLGKVMHKRLLPKVNQFTYNIFYICVPLSDISSFSNGWTFGVNRPGLFSFYNRDHGDRTGNDLESWIKNILAENKVHAADGEIMLVTLPRVLGYIFNPVSFWLCYDKNKNLRAVLCEVNNTFGESHSYLCAHEDNRIISDSDQFQANKLFHVSPFLNREGNYNFRFSINDQNFGVWIDFHNAAEHKQLLTALTGKFIPATAKSIGKVFWTYPLITLKAILLIHFQAIKLFISGIRYVPKPAQTATKFSKSGDITKI